MHPGSFLKITSYTDIFKGFERVRTRIQQLIKLWTTTTYIKIHEEYLLGIWEQPTQQKMQQSMLMHKSTITNSKYYIWQKRVLPSGKANTRDLSVK
jgi:hypothetical protein